MQGWAEDGEWARPDPGTWLQERFDHTAAVASVDTKRMPNFIATRARLKTRGRELAEIIASVGGNIRSELLLTDSVDHLFGIVDIASTVADGLIVDLKTGRDCEGRVSSAIEHQMLFYSHLFAATYGALPARVIAFSLQRGPKELNVTPSGRANLLASIRSVNFASSQDAVPTPENCRFCAKRMTCEPHWEALENWKRPDAIEGIIGKIELSITGATALLVGGKWLIGLHSDELPPHTAPGQRARIVRAQSRGDNSEEWTATRSTRVRIVVAG